MSGSPKTHAELSDVLAKAGFLADSSELHGGICGSLCAGGIGASRAWISDWLSTPGKIEPEVTDARDALDELERETWQALAGSDFVLKPLLPDDDEQIEVRVEALAGWCQGFLGGLGVAGLRIASAGQAREDIEEIIRDFTELSKATLDEGDEADQDTADFQLAEIIEYVRVSVQIVFESLTYLREGGGSHAVH